MAQRCSAVRTLQLPDLVRTHKPQLARLDLVLPGTDGIRLMEGVRELEDLPVIFISAYGREETIVKALDAGADDYIAKPFSPPELTARVLEALRRQAGPEPLLLGELAIHYDKRRVTVLRPGAATPGCAARHRSRMRWRTVRAVRVFTARSA